MAVYVKLFFGGFSAGLVPAIVFLLIIGSVRALNECVQIIKRKTIAGTRPAEKPPKNNFT